MRAAAILAAVAVVPACGGHRAPSAESVARAWSVAPNRSDESVPRSQPSDPRIEGYARGRFG